MRILFISIIAFVLSNGSLCAQDKEMDAAQRHLERLEYAQAIPHLKKAWLDHGHMPALELLGEAYYKVKDYSNAFTYLKTLVNQNNVDPRFYKLHGKVCMNLGNYPEAKFWFKLFIRRNPGDQEIRNLLKSCEIAPLLLNNPLGYGAINVAFNSKYHDFSPIATTRALYFTSSRPGSDYVDPYGWDKQPYLDLFQIELKDSGSTKAQRLPRKINSKTHDGPATFSRDGNSIFFTRDAETSVKQGKMKTYKLKLYSSQRKNSKWSEPKTLTFCDPNSNTGSPALSDDGKRLYFASDMPGGFGGTDIYYVDIIGAENFSAPINCGPMINSAGNENYPFVLNDTVLLFSSDFHPGLGGMDIFSSRILKVGFKAPVNLGSPFNSNKDDFGIFVYPNGERGFFSSNRDGGKGLDDIYEFKKIEIKVLFSVVDSLTYLPLPRAIVRITDGQDVVDTLQTDEQGIVRHKLRPGRNYIISSSYKGFTTKTEKLDLRKYTQNIDTALLIDLIRGPEEFNLSVNVIDDETGKAIVGAGIKLKDKRSGIIDSDKSDILGNAGFKIKQNESYTLDAIAEGYLNESFNITPVDSSISKEVRLRPLKTDFKLNISNIYYELDKSDITLVASQTLDTIVNLLRANPTLIIEIGSHTDSRGDNEYNLKLAERRAKAVIAYVSSKGIDEYRLVWKYYGETQLAVPCPDGVDCPEELHSRNRRTEFKIIYY